MTDQFQWKRARKKPVAVDVAGPFYDTTTVETIEGDYEVDDEYLVEHGGYYIICGVDGEQYPIAVDIFDDTYEFIQ